MASPAAIQFVKDYFSWVTGAISAVTFGFVSTDMLTDGLARILDPFVTKYGDKVERIQQDIWNFFDQLYAPNDFAVGNILAAQVAGVSDDGTFENNPEADIYPASWGNFWANIFGGKATGKQHYTPQSVNDDFGQLPLLSAEELTGVSVDQTVLGPSYTRRDIANAIHKALKDSTGIGASVYNSLLEHGSSYAEQKAMGTARDIHTNVYDAYMTEMRRFYTNVDGFFGKIEPQLNAQAEALASTISGLPVRTNGSWDEQALKSFNFNTANGYIAALYEGLQDPEALGDFDLKFDIRAMQTTRTALQNAITRQSAVVADHHFARELKVPENKVASLAQLFQRARRTSNDDHESSFTQAEYNALMRMKQDQPQTYAALQNLFASGEMNGLIDQITDIDFTDDTIRFDINNTSIPPKEIKWRNNESAPTLE